MLELTRDPAFLNAISNHPSIYPWVRGVSVGPLDFTTMLRSPDTYALMGQHGGVVFIRRQPGILEAHSAYLPSGRGPWALAASLEAIGWAFCHTEAYELM